VAAPTIVSTSPADDETNVKINTTITVVFSEAVDSTTITANTIKLQHANTNLREFARLEVSDDGETLTIFPNSVFDKNEEYILTIIGVDSGLTYYVKSGTGHGLASTVYINFTAGDDVETYSGEKSDEVQEREGDLVLPADIQVVPGERLEIIDTYPYHNSAGLPLTLETISIKFSGPIDPGEFTTDWVDVSFYPLMDMADYLAVDTGDDVIQFSFDDPDGVDFDYPSGTLSVTGEYIYWTRTPGETFPYNTEIEVIFSPEIQDTYGNTLTERRRILFTTEAYPVFTGVRAVLRELPLLPDNMEEYKALIYAMIFRNSLRAWQITGNSDVPAKAYQYLTQYTLAATALDILDDAEIPKSILAGQRKSLGDFYIAYDANAVGKEGLKYKRLKKKLEEAKFALRNARFFRGVVKGLRTDRPYWRSRTWSQYDLYNISTRAGLPVTENIPAANTYSSRINKLPGIYNDWD